MNMVNNISKTIVAITAYIRKTNSTETVLSPGQTSPPTTVNSSVT